MTFDNKNFGVDARVCGDAFPTRRGRRLTGALAALSLMALAVVPLRADAQRVAPTRELTIDSVTADGTVKAVPIPRPNPFNLFAAEDIAAGTLRQSGGIQGSPTNQGGPVSEYFTFLHPQIINNGNTVGFFEMGFVLGAPPSEFRKIRTVYPGINGMAGSLGYTVQYWKQLVTPNVKRIGAADGQFGKAFSGATAVFNGSCRDNGNYRTAGFNLLAMLDCPETWAPSGFDGKRAIADSVWLNSFNSNKASFRWDDWKIAKSRINQNAYLGTQSLYGFMSDYYREQKLRYGSVVPGGSGAPTDPGYPLGLEMRMDSWQFSAPATRNTMFYQVQMVNKSADVYGTGVDYDSLYFGLGPGFVWNGQVVAVYYDFSSNTMFATGGGTSGKCSDSYPKRYENAVTSTSACVGGGFGTGVWSMTLLKSPIGDLRNKLFSNVNSPYYNPTSPLADDTITFNHSKRSSFGQTGQNIDRSMRSGFGMLSSIEPDYLDGRQPSDFTLVNYTQLIGPEFWSGTYPALADVKFPKFVPGNTTNPANNQPFGKWDYNNDGVQDTISVTGCGTRGCAALWSDTIPGGYVTRMGNILNTVSTGPFKLKANDTTQFLWAFSWNTDSITIKQTIAGVVNSYLTNYEGPQPYVFPTVAVGKTYTLRSAELIDSTTFGGANAETGTSISIRYPQINPVDPFMVRLVNKVRADSVLGDATVRRVLRLNPGLLSRLSDRANDNLAAVYVFKSCNGGASYTTLFNVNQGTCVAAPTRTVDDGTLAFDWRPWQRVEYKAGIPATGGVTEKIQAGRNYSYSFVTRSRGFSDFKIVDSTSDGITVSDVQSTLGFPLDTINSALASSGPSVIQIYAPITNTAGRSFARVDTSTIAGSATQSLIYESVSNDVSGTTRLVFGNQFIVRKTIDTVTSAATSSVNVRWVLPLASTSATGPGTANFVAKDQSFTVNQNIPVRSGTDLLTPGTLRGTSGSARVYLDTISAPATYPGFAWITGDNKPIFVLSDMYSTNRQRDEQASPLYPGYTVVPRDTANSSTGFMQELTPFGIVRDRNFVVRGPKDTLQSLALPFVPQVQPIVAASGKRTKGGAYTLTWQVDPWGSKAPFNLDPIANLQGTVTSSLLEAVTKSTTVTETSAAVAALVGATTSRPLQRMKVPFSMTFRRADGTVEPVKFAMLARASNTRLLGSGTDTVRVTVPDSIWLPGDTLVALHKIEKDSTVGTGATKFTVVQADGSNGYRPVPLLVDDIGINRFLVACTGGATGSGVRPAADANTCNPITINSRGASLSGGYLPVAPGWYQFFELGRAFDPQSVVQLVATPFSTKAAISKADLSRVSVVPNPYVARSDVDALSGSTATARIYFTGVPEQGVLRIYSVSGQYLQELTWSKSDLLYQGNNATSGDLPFNLRTREGLDMASGLYLYVLTATGSSGNGLIHRGKFVIIR